MKPWIKSLRLPTCLLSGFLTLLSFRLARIELSYLAAFTVAVIAVATMVWNDWRDKVHDTKKGRRLAHDRPKQFLFFSLMLWAFALTLTIMLFREEFRFGILALCMVVVGMLYSEMRLIPVIPTLFVSVTAASSTLFPLLVGDSGRMRNWLLFAAVAIFIFGREILKDLDDHSIDRGYKWTFPVKIGVRISRVLVVQLWLTSIMIGALINPLSLAGIPLLIAADFYLLVKGDHFKTKMLLDLGAAAATIALFFVG